jgi:hypothetical protein
LNLHREVDDALRIAWEFREGWAGLDRVDSRTRRVHM